MLRRARGFTLIEAMVVVAVVAVLVSIGAPAMGTFIDKNRLKGAADALYTQIQQARSEAVKASSNVTLVYATTPWCSGFGAEADAPCDCTKAVQDGGCQSAVQGSGLSGGDFKGVLLKSAPASITFDGIRGMVAASSAVQNAVGDGGILLESGMGKRLRLEISALGSVRICSPSGATSVGGYPSC